MTSDPTHRAPCSSTTEEEDVPIPFRLSTYQYELPPELIAQKPAEHRDESRLLVVHRKSGHLAGHSFRDLPTLLEPTDLLVFNETMVTPAALTCFKPTGGMVELLVLNPAFQEERHAEDPAERVCLVKSAKRLRSDSRLHMVDGIDLTIAAVEGPGRARIRFPVSEEGLLSFLDRHGTPPLPPYIRPAGRDRSRDTVRYQTVYAKTPGSVAAPTAGLHFTTELLQELEAAGIESVRITLHVGPGTFIPVRVEDIRRHAMETEAYSISEEAAEKLDRALKDNRRIIAVGTTSARALESSIDEAGAFRVGWRSTNLFIKPGDEFRVIRGIITNFHLPGSTLLMMVSAFGGIDPIRKAYETAVNARFRFYSYGDSCLVID